MNESMLVAAVVYLAAAVVCVPIAKALKLGSVLGYLIAGCIIGPFGLGISQDPEATLHFAEIGVVLMLFVIGLELDVRHLWTLRRAVFGGGAFQLFAAAIPLGLGAILLGLPWQAALVTGFALALSSTAVSMQIMGERNLLLAPIGRTAFSILLFQDMAAIPLLALVPLLAVRAEGDTGLPWTHVLSVFGAVLAVIVIGRYLTRPLLRIVVRTGQREVFSAFALLLVLGIAALMAGVGISMALGAFLAGVLLAGSEYRHALETDIEPFRGLLMGLFFIAVGMSIDFGLMLREPGLVLLVVAGFQLIKALTLRLIAGPLDVHRRQRWLLAALLTQGGEFAFVVFGVARTARLLPGEWDGVFTLAIALSMALAPILLIAHDKWLVPVEEAASSEPDVIEDAHAQVIIAGFGRFGQIVGRLLLASGFKATVLDHDPDAVELLRKFGFVVHYGDASRLDLLRAAGAERAKLLVLAIDNPETSVRVASTVRASFPHLSIVARARNVSHWQELRALGVSVVERETFESALLIGRQALEKLGTRPYEAKENADRFKKHNISSLEQLLPAWQDSEKRTELARTAREQLEEQMARDRQEAERQTAQGWHSKEVEADAQRKMIGGGSGG